MKKVVTVGEILLRLSTEMGRRLSQTDKLYMHYGGAETNVGISLAEFGHDVYVISKVPNNPLGIAVERYLRSYRVHTNYLLKGGERLGTYYLETGVGQRSAQVIYDRKNSSFANLEKEEVPIREILHNTDLLHITGITPALSKSLRELTLSTLKSAKEHNVLTSFDFNYRAKLWSQKEAGEVIKYLLPYVDICSCGELDAIHLLGIKSNVSLSKKDRLIYYYKKIEEMYPNIKCFYSTFRDVTSASTNTLQGNLYVNGELYQSKVYEIDHIVDRVGGGDAFSSGILHGLLENLEPKQIVSFATAASVLKHTVHGDGNPFSKEEIFAFANNGSSKISR